MAFGTAFTIRVKILVTLLFLVTAVVSVITFTITNLFHEDKRAHITDLTSVVAMSKADECRSILTGYADRLEVCARILTSEDLYPDQRTTLLRGFFDDFDELVAVTLYADSTEISAVYDAPALAEIGLTKERFREYRGQNAIPLDRLRAGKAYVENSTIDPALPVLTLSMPSGIREGGEMLVVSAVIRLHELALLAVRSSVFDVYVVDSKGMLLAHHNPELVPRRTPAELHTEAQRLHGQFSAGVTVEFEREGRPMIAGYAGVELGGLTVAAEIPRSTVYLASRALLVRLLLISLALLLGAAIVALIGSRQITRPIERLSSVTREIGKGQFDIRVRVHGKDEIATLGSAINQMTVELQQRDVQLTEAQHQLVQSEKMAAFGQLGAGIAHEVKNPLAGILGCAQLALRKVEPGSPVEKNVQLIEKETKRCKTIIENLLRFARQEKALVESVDVNAAVNDAVSIVEHQLELQNVKLEKELAADTPPHRGNANQLQQVLINLLMNAQQAMDGKPGRIVVRTGRLEDGRVQIQVADDGPGMTESVRSKIFDPFFTTKPGGKGTGLGLSVSFGIIRDHRGEISVESSPGKGATFTIILPSMSVAGAGDERAA